MTGPQRPLDWVRSIKAKLGILVAASIAATSVLTWLFATVWGWKARFSLTLAVIIGLVVSQILARGMTSPLRQMTAAARDMAAGRSAGPVRATSRDEVGDLARAFSAMADDLATADAQRRDLLANVAHELRTPVTALRAQVENLVDGVRPSDETALTEVLSDVTRLGDLVDDLLGLARAEAGVIPLRPTSCDVADLANDVVAAAQVVRPDRRYVVDVAPGLTVPADPARLRQALVNLVDNAARHAPAGGAVAVIGRPDARGGVTIEVVDDGPGIPQEDRSAVFERFRRGALDQTPPRGAISGGTGLGLAIARWAVVLHGGRIGVVPVDAGCRIRIELPGP